MSHPSSYQIYDVGVDGAPISIDIETGEEEEVTQSKAAAFWNIIKVSGFFSWITSIADSRSQRDCKTWELKPPAGGTTLGYEYSSDESAHHALGIMNVSDPQLTPARATTPAIQPTLPDSVQSLFSESIQ